MIYFKGIRQLNVFLFYIVIELDIGKELLGCCRQRLLNVTVRTYILKDLLCGGKKRNLVCIFYPVIIS